MDALLRALKATVHKLGGKGSTTVGVLEYPNVGKSSVTGLTALFPHKRGGSSNVACPTDAEAGVTSSVREVEICNKLKILDVPDLVLPIDSSLSAQQPHRHSPWIALRFSCRKGCPKATPRTCVTETRYVKSIRYSVVLGKDM